MKIGSLIKQERENKGVSLEHISSVTKISVEILKYLEEDNYEYLPARPYIRGFVFALAKELDIDTNLITKSLNESFSENKIDNTVKKQARNRVQQGIKTDVVTAANSGVVVVDKDTEIDSVSSGSLMSSVSDSFPGANRLLIVGGGFVCITMLLLFLFYDKSPVKSPQKNLAGLSNNINVSSSPKAEVVSETLTEKSTTEVIKTENTEPLEKTAIKSEEKAELKNKPALFTKTGFSWLRIKGKSNSLVKLQIDSKPVQAVKFISGMARRYRISDSVKIYFQDTSAVDVYFRDSLQVVGTESNSSNQIKVFKHISGGMPVNKKRILTQKKPLKIIKPLKKKSFSLKKVDKELIIPPTLTPEQLTR